MSVLSDVFIARAGLGRLWQVWLVTRACFEAGEIRFSRYCNAAAPLVLPGLRKLAMWFGVMAKSRLLMVWIDLNLPARDLMASTYQRHYGRGLVWMSSFGIAALRVL